MNNIVTATQLRTQPGVMRRLMSLYQANGIDEATAAEFARAFLQELNGAAPGTVWYVCAVDGTKQAFRKGDK